MSNRLSGVGLSPVQMAIIGLLYPAPLKDGASWADDERHKMRSAARSLQLRHPMVLGTECDAVAHAQIAVNSRVKSWWPYAYIPGCVVSNPIDLSLPILWGAEWLYDRLEEQGGFRCHVARVALRDIQLICDSRLEALRAAEDCITLVAKLRPLEPACRAASRAIAKVGPVLLFPDS
jgi:hypothetical protein